MKLSKRWDLLLENRRPSRVRPNCNDGCVSHHLHERSECKPDAKRKRDSAQPQEGRSHQLKERHGKVCEQSNSCWPAWKRSRAEIHGKRHPVLPLFSLATDDVWNDKGSGERQERTEWHSIVAWDRLAEICNEYLTKGKLVYIEGSLQTREWDDQEGNKRKTTEIRARDLVMLSGAGDGAGGQRRAATAADVGGSGAVASSTSTITDDDIPF